MKGYENVYNGSVTADSVVFAGEIFWGELRENVALQKHLRLHHIYRSHLR
jgi:hypothetical protein